MNLSPSTLDKIAWICILIALTDLDYNKYELFTFIYKQTHLFYHHLESLCAVFLIIQSSRFLQKSSPNQSRIFPLKIDQSGFHEISIQMSI